MSTISWTAMNGGSWQTASDLSGGAIPTSSDTAVIGTPGSYTVNNFGAAVANSLTPDAAGVTLGDYGTISLGGRFLLEAGEFALQGTLVGGTIDGAGGTLFAAGGTLDAVALQGDVELTGFSGLTVIGGLGLIGANGAGAGKLDLQSGSLTFSGSQTIAAGTIMLGGPGMPSHRYSPAAAR